MDRVALVLPPKQLAMRLILFFKCQTGILDALGITSAFSVDSACPLVEREEVED
jgi:hypothetical protein